MTKEEKRTLKQFLQHKIPKGYMQLDISNAPSHTEEKPFDLMVCHEELFDHAWCAVHNKAVDRQHNFMNTLSASLTPGFAEYLHLIRKTHPDMQEFCDLCISVISILGKLDIHTAAHDS